MNQQVNGDPQGRRQSSKGIAQSQFMLLNLRGDLSEASSPKSRYGGDETRSNRIFTDNSGQQTFQNFHKPLVERRRNKIGTEVTGMYRMAVSAPRRSRRWSNFGERTFQFQQETLDEEKNKYDKFGFIKPESIYGNEEYEGLFNYEAQARTLKAQHKQPDYNVNTNKESGNNDNNGNTDRQDNLSETLKYKQKQNSLLDRMANHIKDTSKLQRQFLEMSMEDVKPRITEDSKRKDEEMQGNTQREVLNKLNSHIKFIKEREQINLLEKQLNAASNSATSKGQPSNINMPKTELIVNSEEGKKQSSIELSFLHRKNGKNQEDNIENNLSQAKSESNAKTKMKKIIATHQNAVRDIEYVYSDVAKEIKKTELLKKIHRLQDTKSKLQKIQQQRDKVEKIKRTQNKDQPDESNMQQTISQNNKMLNSTKDTIGFQKDKKISLNKTITSLPPTQLDNNQQKESIQTQFKTIGMSRTFDKDFFHPKSLIDPKHFEVPSRLRKNSANNLRQKKETKTSVNLVCAQLETANQSLAEIEKKTESENKVYFKQTYKVRERGLTFELADSENKEAVLDRVMMSYFHQQDLLEQQIDLLKKEKQNTKSSQNNIVLNEFLSKFQPAHMRLHLKDISNRVSLDSSSILSSRHKRSRTWDKPGWVSDRQTNRYAEEIADGCETDIYREEYQTKKTQLKMINYQKVCSSGEMVKSFMRSDPYKKKRESIEAIDYLVQFNADNMKADEERDGGGTLIPSELPSEKEEMRKQDEILRRCFFKYSNKSDASTVDKYQRMHLEGFLEFFQSLAAQKSTHETIANAICGHQGEDEIDETQKAATLNDLNVQTIFNQIIKKKGQQYSQHHWVNFYEFLQILEKTSIQFYLKTVQQVESMPEPQKLFQRFCLEMIFPLNLSFRDPVEIELINMIQIKHVQKVLQFFEDAIKPLFVIAGSLRSEFAPDDSSIYLQFQEVFDMLEKIQLFPTKISKVTIRYIYFYVLDLDHGLDFSSFCRFFHLLALSAVRQPLQHNSINKKRTKASIPKRKCREVQAALYNLRIDNQLNKSTQKFIEDISAFYIEAQYLDMQNIPNKVAEIRGTVQQMLNQI